MHVMWERLGLKIQKQIKNDTFSSFKVKIILTFVAIKVYIKLENTKENQEKV